ncbi:FAD-dependent oxidoreductase [Nocardioides hwasunensis]|uniref:D-amino-acid oxidase n=1 Tax=Nocardioides hwasunensis TaxID=397258 RepID=A0ABR8MJE6_9ACTN|nr:FAD-dependent oxidoreductase [Nocardioides hwasunensis]MBD3916053.1 FAD-binding oxidoreductase [Nocardioides hwasunensis]
MSSSARRVIVVGAGVVGLTCAVRLLEAGHRVDVVARDLPLETTSAVAAALWYPYRALPEDRVTAWSATSYAALEQLAADEASGVRMLTGTEVLADPQPDPWWRDAVPELDRETSLPPGYADGWTFVSPVLDMPVHLRWLVARIEELGGTLTRMNLSALPDDGSLVVNATGLGARHFGADPSVTPVRGQVVVLEQVGLERWTLDSGAGGGGPIYVVPRGSEIVVGGTDVEGEWSRTPDPAVADEILHRATALVPEIEGARVVRHKVGLRPARPSVRLERVGEVIHCYGHGGAGVTMAWGCADDVADLAGG